MSPTDFRKYYDLSTYLFNEVSGRFSRNGTLSVFDFFCIVIWKANRAKSKVANRLLSKQHSTLEDAISALGSQIHRAADDKERLRVLILNWGFRLPMASAILTVLYPQAFTVYDVRVCEMLGDFDQLQHRTKFEAIWSGYSSYVQRVRDSVPENLSLREKDKELWGESFATDLQRDIDNKFLRDKVSDGGDA